MAAFIEILSVILIVLLILFEKVSLKLAFSSPPRYRLDLVFFAIEGSGEREQRQRGIRVRRFFNLYRRIRHSFHGLRYLIRHSTVEKTKEKEYDLVLRFYLFRLCLAALIILKERLKSRIKRRVRNVGK